MSSVLIAESHVPTRCLRARILEDAGFAVSQSDSGSSALSAVRQAEPPDLVLLEVGLPDASGYQVCEEIKGARPSLPVILISGIYRTAQARRDGLKAGADAYLVDPTPATRLVDAVRRLTVQPDETPDIEYAVARTTPGGTILWINDIAARLLNITKRAAPGRNLLTFFNGERVRLQTEVARAAAGQVCELSAMLRPRERRPFAVRLDLAAADQGGIGEVEWILEPVFAA